MLDFVFAVNQWLVDRTDHSAPVPALPSELWALVFNQTVLRRRDWLALFATCRRFNVLVLPLVDYFAGTWTVDAELVGLLNHAVHLPNIQEITCTYDVHSTSTPYLLRALERLLNRRATSVRQLKLNFRGDLLSAYKSDLVPLTPQRALTAPFCALLSSFAGSGSDPVVLVGTEVFSSSAAGIRTWQLDKYAFNASPTRGLLAGLQELILNPSPPVKGPLRTKVPLKHHNGLITLVSPLISISSVHIRRITQPFSTNSPQPWTLVVFNAGSVHWPSSLRLGAPLASDEWGAVLPMLQFANLPVVRMDPCDIPARTLDAFLARHPTLTRMYYYPAEGSLDASPAPLTLPRLRQLTTTARGACRFLREAGVAFPHLSALRVRDVTQFTEMFELLGLLKNHQGTEALILEAPAGAWMEGFFTSTPAVDLVRSLHRVNLVVLSGATSRVDPEVIIRWLRLFPSLRGVGLQDCLHRDGVAEDNAWEEMRRGFAQRAREVLGEEDGLDVMVTV
ncbi:hypothetical protein C8F01DRAFT_1153491 [Mycena amicta]|nr:hypothetical protein C8F01DRAFT_1153491 [Mycena amicta]